MNATESLTITRFVKAACPQQKFDEFTPDAWHELLADVDFGDARAAVVELGKRGPFISPAEIRSEVRHIRAERVRAVPAELLDPIDVDPDDVPAWLAAKRERVEAIASGRLSPEATPVTGAKRPVAALLAAAADRHRIPAREQSA